MKGFLLSLTYKIENFFQKFSERRTRKKCIDCGDCDECSMTGICTLELERNSDDIIIED